jgi:pentatricopeptide repeat protein
VPSGGTLESLEKNYAELRQKTDAADRNPELYLLAGYFELREFERVERLLRQMSEKSPNDAELRMLNALYARAIGNARMAAR